MKRYMITLSFLAIGLAGVSQLNYERGHYLLLNDSTTIEGNSLLFRKQNSGAIFLMDMTIPVLADSVDMFRNFHGTFARIPKPLGYEAFALRIRNGEISLFERVDMRLYSDADLMIEEDLGVNPQVQGLATGRKFHYFDKDGEMMKATVNNLKNAMIDNAVSYDFMQRYRRNQWLQVGMIAGGAAAATYGAVGIKSQGTFNPITIFGGILAASSLFIQPIKNDLQWMAVESYNGQ